MENNANHADDGFFLIPANGGGAVVQRSQIAGARPNGSDGAIVYCKSGPSIYTTMTTKHLADMLGARLVEARN